MVAVGVNPGEYRMASKSAMDCIPASSGSGGMASPGLDVSAIDNAQARPKTTISNKLLAPNRLAPWTDAHATSPAAYNPGTTTSSSHSPVLVNLVFKTCP